MLLFCNDISRIFSLLIPSIKASNDPEEIIHIIENTIINNRSLSTSLKRGILEDGSLSTDYFVLFALACTMEFNESIFLISDFLERITNCLPTDTFSFLVISYTMAMLLKNHRTTSTTMYDFLLRAELAVLDYPFKEDMPFVLKRISCDRITIFYSKHNENTIKESALHESISKYKGGPTKVSNETVNNFIHHFKEAFELSLRAGFKTTITKIIKSLSLASLSVPFGFFNDALLQTITLLAPGLIMDVLDADNFSHRLPLHLLIPDYAEDNEQLSLILGISNSYKALVKNVPLPKTTKLPLAPSLLFSLVSMGSNDSISDSIRLNFDTTISNLYSSNDLLEMIILLLDLTLEQQQPQQTSVRQIIALDRTLGVILDSCGKSTISQLIIQSFPGIMYYFQNRSWGTGARTGKEIRLYKVILTFLSYCKEKNLIPNPDNLVQIINTIVKNVSSLPLHSYDDQYIVIDLLETLKVSFGVQHPTPPFNFITTFQDYSSKKVESVPVSLKIFDFVSQIPSLTKKQFGTISIIFFCQHILEDGNGSNGENIILIINYLLQEALEGLGLRDSNNKWASSVWNLFPSSMKDSLRDLLTSRYRCERVYDCSAISIANNTTNSDLPFSPSILPGSIGNLWNLLLKSQLSDDTADDSLLKMVHGLSIPDRLGIEIISILLFIELLDDKYGGSNSCNNSLWKDITLLIDDRKNNGTFDHIVGDVFCLLFEQITIITPSLHKKILLRKRSLLKDLYDLVPMELILSQLSISTSIEKKKMSLRISEELSHLTCGSWAELLEVASKSVIGLNLPILESGYLVMAAEEDKDYNQTTTTMLTDSSIDDLESLSKTSLDINVEFSRILGKDLSFIEGMTRHNASRALSAYQELQSWGFNNDSIYDFGCVHTGISASVATNTSTGNLKVTKNISEYLLINDEIIRSGFKKTLLNVNFDDCSKILYGSKMISNKLSVGNQGGLAVAFKTNLALLYANKLRQLKEPKMAHLIVKSLKEQQHQQNIYSSDYPQKYNWRLDYYEAKIMFERGLFNGALSLLNSIFVKDLGISNVTKSKISSLIAKITYKSKAFSDSLVRETFERCVSLCSPLMNSKVQYLFSLYLDECNGRFNDLNLTYQTIKSFAKTISFDQRYDRIACCRFFSLFFDVGDCAAGNSGGKSLSGADMGILKKIISIMDRVVVKVPMFKFLPNLSQLASKICQCDNSILKNVQDFIVKLLHEFPHTVIWKIINFVLSINGIRKQKYSFIQASSKSDPVTHKLWGEYTKVCKILIDICALSPSNPKDNTITLSKSSLNKVNSIDLSLVATPISTVIYRNSKDLEEDFIYISEFKSKLDVFPSLQKPKRLMVLCSDGFERSFLCKPKDDLRKDMRFLELASLTNDIIKTGHIITYAALPLNEEAGVIEWIDNTISLRSILFQLYKEKGISIDFAEVRDLQKTKNFSNTFTEVILKKYLYNKNINS